MAKVIKKSDGAGFFAKGGTTSMFGEGTAHPKVPGISGKEGQGGNDAKFASGGRTKMFGKGYANQAPAGVSAKNSQ